MSQKFGPAKAYGWAMRKTIIVTAIERQRNDTSLVQWPCSEGRSPRQRRPKRGTSRMAMRMAMANTGARASGHAVTLLASPSPTQRPSSEKSNTWRIAGRPTLRSSRSVRAAINREAAPKKVTYGSIVQKCASCVGSTASA